LTIVSRPPEAHGFRYAPGLDGVRALAVLSVVAYHIGTTSDAIVLPGGFLGVDIFFVLSGYLITSLLVVEAQQHHGRISIKQFYIRRARRLLPALFALLLVVGAIGAFWLPQQAARLRGDLVASLGYVTNWWLVAENSSYFGAEGDRPQLLTHLWSLAVEEQYYLVWPIVLIVFAKTRAPRWVMLFVLAAGIVASTAAAAVMYDPFSDPSRVYYGTDTRALAPLLGAALAIAVCPWRHRERLPPRTRHLLDALGIFALVLLAVVAAMLHDTDDALYLGGFLVIAALGAVVVGVAGHPGTALGEMLGTQPWRWLGERSYAIYLWHWPVCVLSRPGVDVPITGWANAGLRIALTIVLADLSYRLIETPIRRNGLIAPFKARGAAKAAIAVAVAAGARRAGAGARRVGAQAHRAAASRVPVFRSVALMFVMVVGGSAVGVQLSTAAGAAPVGGPVDAAPDRTLGPLPYASQSSAPPSPDSSPTAKAWPLIPKGSKVAIFGDSQGSTLILNRPADLGEYIEAHDVTITGCGILLGKVASSTGERRNLSSNCPNWLSEWQSDAQRLRPDLAVIMLGAWDVFDLILDSGDTLTFGTPEWDAHYTDAVRSAVDAVLTGTDSVAFSLLPCYRPIRASAGFWPERGDDDRTRHVNELLKSIAASYPTGVYTVEPPTDFCTDPNIATNTSYRWDGIHYYKKGAALYFSAVLPQILQP
jgi:peptidoglycan/LPS O-acetylase OafA/YrhL/lysophospholipase L1-like esterase